MSRYVNSKNFRPTIHSVGSKRLSYAEAQQAKHNAAVVKRRAAMMAGVTRTEGAYRRSIPYSGETKYADMDVVASNTATSTTLASYANGSTGALSITGTILNFCNIPGAIGAQGSLLQVAQGTTKNTRIANKLKLYAIRGHFVFVLPANSSATSYDSIRFILYLDRQANGSAATAGNILENPTNGTINVTSKQAMDYVDRIKIIKDKIIDMNPQYGVQGASSGPLVKHFKFNHKCNCEIRYSSTTGTITEIQSDNFGVLMITSGTPGNATISQGQVRIYFKDH